jgi:hypothetical protein
MTKGKWYATSNVQQNSIIWRHFGNNPPKSIHQFQAFNIQKRQTNRDKKGSQQFSVPVRSL